MITYNSTFKDLLENPLLKETTTPAEPNILEIGKGVKELTISNLYAYFLDPNPKEPHGLDSLFLDALQEIIKKHDKIIELNQSNIRVKREQKTTNNFVDLIIEDGKSAIIIENKLYASLYNDFDDYFKSFKYDNKIGVVLAINSVSKVHENFISISHQELCEEIQRQFLIKNESLQLTERQKENFFTFIENLKSHYKIVDNLEQKVEFIDKNIEQIRNLNQILLDVKESYLNQFFKITKELFVENFKRNNLSFRKANPHQLNIDFKELPIKGYIFTKPESINTITFSLWIAENSAWVEAWFKDDRFYELNKLVEEKFNDIKVDREDNSKYWASMYYKDYMIKPDNVETLVSSFEESLRNEWLIIIGELAKIKI